MYLGWTKYGETPTPTTTTAISSSLSSHFFSLNNFSSIIRVFLLLLLLQWVQPNAHSESHHVQFIYNFFGLPFILLPLLQSQKLFNLYLFFFLSLHIIQRKYDGVHSISAIHISRVCLSLFAPFCYSLPEPSQREKQMNEMKWNRCVVKPYTIKAATQTFRNVCTNRVKHIAKVNQEQNEAKKMKKEHNVENWNAGECEKETIIQYYTENSSTNKKWFQEIKSRNRGKFQAMRHKTKKLWSWKNGHRWKRRKKTKRAQMTHTHT